MLLWTMKIGVNKGLKRIYRWVTNLLSLSKIFVRRKQWAMKAKAFWRPAHKKKPLTNRLNIHVTETKNYKSKMINNYGFPSTLSISSWRLWPSFYRTCAEHFILFKGLGQDITKLKTDSHPPWQVRRYPHFAVATYSLGASQLYSKIHQSTDVFCLLFT